MISVAELQDGMKVRTSDGHDLGKIIRLDAGILVIEKGFFFPKDYEVPISMVSAVRDGEAHLSISKEAIEREGGLTEATGTGAAAPGTASWLGREDAGSGWDERTRRPPGAAIPGAMERTRAIERRADRAVRREEARVERTDEDERSSFTRRDEDGGGGLLGLGRDDDDPPTRR